MIAYKEGDRVVCVDNTDFTDQLTVGKVYEAGADCPGGPCDYLEVKNDQGEVESFYCRRFKAVPAAEAAPPSVVDLPATKDTNPKDAAATSRLDLSLVPSTAVFYMAIAFTEGHLKYGAYNWRDAGVLASVYYAAFQRHVSKWWNGEECDPDTGVPHLASAMACLAVLADAQEIGELKDDRPPAMDAADILKRFEKLTKDLQGKFQNGPKRHTEAAR